MSIVAPYEELKNVANIPVSSGMLRDIYANYRSPQMHIALLEQKGILIRLKRGLYVVSPDISGKPLSLELAANHIYGPSYVSMHYALRYYGLIPEHVFMLTSMTIRHTRTFENSLARFSYIGISTDYFPIGITMKEEHGVTFLIATPEKALCDMLMVEKYIPHDSIKSLATFFEEDMRIDLDELKKMDTSIIKACMQVSKKKQILSNLIKLIEL